MQLKHTLCATALVALVAPAFAAVSADEAQQLGTTLTDFGAIKAGNPDGSIPPYTGGVTKAPADFKPDSGFWVDPFKDEKSLFRIDSQNMSKYADKLSEGQKMLLKQNPSTYYIDVYPSHRSAAYPDFVLKATVRNATVCELEKDDLAIIQACRGGMPFPIPKNGNQAMWNHVLKYQGHNAYSTPSNKSWVIDTVGKPTLTATQSTWVELPFYQTTLTDRDPSMASRLYSYTSEPARNAGVMTGVIDFLDPVAKVRRAWSYTPGQRRVKLSPEFSYDTPVASQGGVTLFDELFIFSGKLDRFDFKLAGKKEMYIPYNSYKSTACPADKALMAKHANPECERWELHRVWVIEATLKSGMRHAYAKRTYYFDEDQTGAGLYDAWDHSGNLYRSLFNGWIQLYDKVQPLSNRTVLYDFNKGNWAYVNDVSTGGYKVNSPRADREMAPEATAARETTR
jgi:hypothetical protein